MVAKITHPKRVHAALNYNENKVSEGKAACLCAANYLADHRSMNFYQKLNGLERLNELNDRAVTKTLHISLNFSPTESLTDEKLIRIGSVYMEKIGFGEQPFLLYRHVDAGHPHLHIVSTTIKADGSRINTHNLGRIQSEKARKELEIRYGLVKAEDQKQEKRETIKAVDVCKIVYGKQETRRSIANVVSAVMNAYRFTSLPEFNAILRQFNIVADRGSEGSRVYRNRGLVYKILDANGNKIGVPIKASTISSQPTLKKLEEKFSLHQQTKELFKKPLIAKVNDALRDRPTSVAQMIEQLKRKNIYTLLRKNEAGRTYGITFVDNASKTVFNGSDLGKEFSVAQLQRRVEEKGMTDKQEANGKNQTVVEKQISKVFSIDTNVSLSAFNQLANHAGSQKENLSLGNEILAALTHAEKNGDAIPFQFAKQKRKRKKKFLRL